MKSLVKKDNGFKMKGLAPVFKSWLDDFWGAEKFFDDNFFRGEWMPAVNIKDNEKDYEIEMAAPGMKKKDFKITVENGVLNILAEKEESKEEKEDNYTRKEFSFNSFCRSFTLPANVQEDDIAAKYADGILRLTLKKAKVEEPAMKEVKVN